MVAEEMDHGAIREKGVAKRGGQRVRTKPCEERVKGLWGKAVGIEVDEVDEVLGFKGWEKGFE